MKTVDQLIDEIIYREDRTGTGVYTNDPKDKGGPTRWGITLTTLQKYLHRPCTAEDVRTLPRELAVEIYKDEFYVQPKINQLPGSIQPSVMDAGVMSNPVRAVKLLQDVLNMAGFPCGVDGYIGPRTREQAVAADKEMGPFLVNAYADRRIHFYNYLAHNEGDNDPDQKWLKGWINRANEFKVPV